MENLKLKEGDNVYLIDPRTGLKVIRVVWKVTPVGYRVSGTPGGRSTIPSILFNKQGKITGSWKKDYIKLKIPKNQWYYLKPLKKKS